MTRRLGENVNCAHCGKKLIAEYYASVNVSLDADLKKEVVLEKLNRITCPHCHQEFVLSLNPFVYHDMNRRRYIFVYPKERSNEKEKIEREARDFEKNFSQTFEAAHGQKRASELKIATEIIFGMDTLAFEISQHDHDPTFRYGIEQGMRFDDEQGNEIAVVANYPCANIIHIKALVGRKQLGYATLFLEHYSDLSKKCTALKTIASEVIIDPVRDNVQASAIKQSLQKYIRHIQEKLVK